MQQPDVLVLGGGLAGLTFAMQLLQRQPQLRVRVIERRRHPAPPAAHKVGESTVEIGAHYFAEALGLQEHMETEQLKKFGFRFFFNDCRGDIENCAELGVSHVLPTPTYQIDRGTFETFLGEEARRRGIEFIDGAVVRRIDLSDDGSDHSVEYEHAGARLRVNARWVVDASGRAGLIKRKLDLAEPNDHNVNAVWFRLEGKVDVNDWCDDEAWLARCNPRNRWLSTNHLCGEGYWAWLIPLGSGAHSVGIVADEALHPLDTMNTFDKSLAWLHKHQPQLGRVCEARREGLMDFLFLRHFSYSCKQVFSGQRWALTGEAGLFLDPFYSPGSDFIAISNTYICELIEKDLAGEPVAPWARIFQDFYYSFYRNTMTLYQDQYALFGDPEVMTTKVIWDYTYYWGVLCPLYFQNRLADINMLGRLRGMMTEMQALNGELQPLMRAWGEHHRAAGNGRLMNDQTTLPWFVELNRGLRDRLDDDALFARMQLNTERLRDLACEIVARARTDHPGLNLDSAPNLRALVESRELADSLLFARAA
jgi:flavin-dependent dehydrogenase